MFDNATETQIRRALYKRGLMLRKSRKRKPTYYDEGGYIIINPYVNGCVWGSRCELTLDDVRGFLNDLEREEAAAQ